VLALEDNPILRSFAASPDGKWLAGARASADDPQADQASLALYDAATGKRHAVCDGQPGPITALAFSTDGAVLASGGVQSCDVWLWQVPSGEPLMLIPDAVDDCSVEALAFQPNGRLLAIAGIDWMATGGDDGEVVLWHLDERRAVHSVHAGATAVAFHPKGRLLAYAALNHIVRIWDVVEQRVQQELRGHQDTVACLAWSPDGRLLATAGEDRVVRLWEAASGELVGAWELDNPIASLAFTPDGKSLFTGNANTSCYQIDVEELLASGQ
jgi:WD40 repeat protein